MNRTVLIVDDDANARIIAETLLRLRGLRVCSTGDGSEAYDFIQRDDVAVVVLDLGMAGMNGIEGLRHLRSRLQTPWAQPEPRLIAVTSRKEPEIERFARRLGADAFLRKPLQPAQLINTVEQLLTAAAPARSLSLAPPRS